MRVCLLEIKSVLDNQSFLPCPTRTCLETELLFTINSAGKRNALTSVSGFATKRACAQQTSFSRGEAVSRTFGASANLSASEAFWILRKQLAHRSRASGRANFRPRKLLSYNVPACTREPHAPRKRDRPLCALRVRVQAWGRTPCACTHFRSSMRQVCAVFTRQAHPRLFFGAE